MVKMETLKIGGNEALLLNLFTLLNILRAFLFQGIVVIAVCQLTFVVWQVSVSVCKR